MTERLSTPNREWQVEPATLTATGKRFGDGEWLLILHHGHLVGTVRARRSRDGETLDAATLAELARYGVPLAELAPEPMPAPATGDADRARYYLPATPAARKLRAIIEGETK